MTDIDNILEGKTAIKVAGQMVVLNSKNLAFTEATLSGYMEKEAAWYDYFGQRLADAESENQYFDLKYDQIYSEKYTEYKDSGCTDKLSEANAKVCKEVIKAKEEVILSKHKVKLLQQHLRAWDKNHDNAQSCGHMLRKSIDKLNSDIFLNRDTEELEDKLKDVIGKK